MNKRFIVSVLAVVMLVVCFVGLTACKDTLNEHTHEYGGWTSDNTTTHSRTCGCGEKETKDHLFGSWIAVDEQAHSHECSVCGLSIKENHRWDSGSITNPANCRDDGVRTYTCLDCGKTKTETIDKNTNHTWGKWTTSGESTHSRVCSTCDTREIVEHTWNDGATTKQPTCKETGIKTFTCLDCEQTKTETIPVVNHTYGDWTSDNTATHTHTCNVCGNSETVAHRWNDGMVTKIATCKEAGLKTFACLDCGATRTETIEQLTTHTFSKWTSVNAETHTHICSVCGITETTPHNFVNEVCTDCGYANIPASITGVQNATVDFDNSSVYMLVDKTTQMVNLSNMVKVSVNSSWKLYTAKSELIPTKLATLANGENSYLIVVSSADGLYDNTYTLAIYKSFEITVRYYNVYNNVIYTDTADTGYLYNIEYTPEITGYTFNYWKLNDEQTTSVTPYVNINLFADCTVNNYTLTLDPNGGDVEQTEYTITFDTAYTINTPTRTGYTFDGWYIDDTKITNVNEQSVSNWKYGENKTATARWNINSYRVRVYTNNSSYGTVSGGTTYDYDSLVTVTATTKAGYTFTGWYDGETLKSIDLQYTFNMPAQDVSYTAKWCKVSTASNNTTAGIVTALTDTYIAGEQVNVVATTKTGYTFIGWYNGETLVNNNLTCTLTMPTQDTTYTAKWCKITIKNDDITAGTVTTLGDTYVANEQVTVTATANEGYSFVGWYNDDLLIDNSPNYTFSMPVQNVTFTAKWQINSYTVNIGGTEYDSSVTGGGTYVYNSTVTVTATPITGYTFKGWYDSRYYGTLISRDLSFSFTMPAQDVTCVAIWYRITLKSDNINAGTVTKLNEAYMVGDQVTIAAIANIGYVFTGWYSYGYTLISNDSNYTFEMPDYEYNQEYVAKWDVLEEFKPFDFTSTTTTCSVRRVKNKNVTEIIIPDSVTSIGESAFSGCSSLTSVTIGNSVTSIGSLAFYSCSNLTNVYYTGDIESWCGISGLNNIMSSTSRTLYINNEALTGELVIPDTVTEIKQHAFAGCTNITNVTIPDSVMSIGEYAFAYGGLETVYWNATDCIIDSKFITSPFGSNSTLTTVFISDNVTSIPNGAFRYCKGLTNVTIGNSVTTIGVETFYGCSSLTSVTIPDSVTEIGSLAFTGCDGLTSVTIGCSVTMIDSNAFFNCNSLTSVYYTGDIAGWCNISFGVEDASPMSKADNLYINNEIISGDVVIPDGIKSIPIGTFKNSTITSVIIPDSVTTIGERAFQGCSNLQYNEYDNAQYLGNIDNPYVVLVKAKSTNITSYEINNNTKVIYYSAFSGRAKMTNIIIPDSVTTIGEYAFRSCSSLTSVTIGNSVTSIGHSAFSNCSSLTSVTIPDSVTSIGYSAFENCSSLTSVTIPDSVTTIGEYAFRSCSSLTSVTIGNSVTEIGYAAFSSCSSLTSVYYKGTASEWNNIIIGNNTNLTNATRYYYSETEPELNDDGTDYNGNYWHYDTDGVTPIIWKKEN